MMGSTHRLVNGTTAFVATTAVHAPISLVTVAVVGSMASFDWPDVDQKIKFIPHRRITHWPAMQILFFAVLAGIGAYFAPQLAGLIVISAAALAFGCVMHSVADAMTVDPRGIQLLWPISLRGYHLLPWSWRIRVGSKSRSELLFVAVWCGFVLIYVHARFGHLIFA